MSELCKFGLFTLIFQGGISSTYQETIEEHIHDGYLQWTGFLVQGFEAVTNGTYWVFGIIILVYLFYLIFVRQVVANFANDKNPFKRLENPIDDQNVPINCRSSNASFCSTSFEAAPFSVPYVPSFTLSEEDAKHLRTSLRQVWSLSREPRTRPSALEILNTEIQESRRLRHELEKNLEKILQENEGLASDRPDWADHLVKYKINRASLRERMTSSQDRLTPASILDHKIIQHRLAASKTEIRELQLQIDELKTEKQSAIELVSKILFRPESANKRLMLSQHEYNPHDQYRNLSDDHYRNFHASSPKSSICLNSTSCINSISDDVSFYENCSDQLRRDSNIAESGVPLDPLRNTNAACCPNLLRNTTCHPDPPRNTNPGAACCPNQFRNTACHLDRFQNNVDCRPDPPQNTNPAAACCPNQFRNTACHQNRLRNNVDCRPDPLGSCSNTDASRVLNQPASDPSRNNSTAVPLMRENPNTTWDVRDANNVTVDSSGTSLEAEKAETEQKPLLSIVDPSQSFGVESSALGSSVSADLCYSESSVGHCSSSEDLNRATETESSLLDVAQETKAESCPALKRERGEPPSEVIGDGVAAERSGGFSGPVTGSPLFRQFFTSYVKEGKPE